MHINADTIALPSIRPDTLAANVAALQASLPNLPHEELLRILGAAGRLISRNPQNVINQLFDTEASLDIKQQASAQCMLHTLAIEAGLSAYIHCSS